MKDVVSLEDDLICVWYNVIAKTCDPPVSVCTHAMRSVYYVDIRRHNDHSCRWCCCGRYWNACIFEFIYVCVFASVCLYVCVFQRVCVCVYLCACVRGRMYLYVCTCMLVWLCRHRYACKLIRMSVLVSSISSLPSLLYPSRMLSSQGEQNCYQDALSNLLSVISLTISSYSSFA